MLALSATNCAEHAFIRCISRVQPLRIAATYWRSLYPTVWLYESPTNSVELHGRLTPKKEMIGQIDITLLVQSAVAVRQWFFLARSQIIRTLDLIYKGLLPTLFAGGVDYELTPTCIDSTRSH
jgi:hypothetical protein